MTPEEKVRELEALLDNYRGTCQDCGRVNVLLTDDGSSYDPEYTCLLDQEECQRLHAVRLEEQRLAYLKRREETPNDPMWTMKDYYNKTMLESLQGIALGRNPLEPGRQTYEWRTTTVRPAEYGPFYKGADDDKETR